MAISKYYFDLAKTADAAAGTLQGPQKLQENTNFTSAKINQFFEEDETLRQFYGAPKRNDAKNQRNVTSTLPLRVVHLDLIVFAQEKHLLNRKYLGIVATDSYSRYSWIIPVPAKDGVAMKRGLTELLKEMKPYRYLPAQQNTVFFSDQGLEFKVLIPFLKAKGHSIAFSIGTVAKAFLAERFIRTFRRMLFLLQMKMGWSKYLEAGGWQSLYKLVLNIYNTTIHSALNKCTPTDILQLKPDALNRYQKLTNRTMESYLEGRRRSKAQWASYQNSYVRLLLKHRMFQKKALQPIIGREIFRVIGYRPPKGLSTKSILLQLEDLMGEKIKGFFRLDELMKIQEKSTRHPKNKGFLPTISKIIKKSKGTYTVTLAGNFFDSVK